MKNQQVTEFLMFAKSTFRFTGKLPTIRQYAAHLKTSVASIQRLMSKYTLQKDINEISANEVAFWKMKVEKLEVEKEHIDWLYHGLLTKVKEGNIVQKIKKFFAKEDTMRRI